MNASNPRDIGELARLAVGASQAITYVSSVLQRLGPVQEQLSDLQKVIGELEQTIQNFEAARTRAAQGDAASVTAPPAATPATSATAATATPAEAEPDRAPPAPEVGAAPQAAVEQHAEAVVEDNPEIQAEATTLGSFTPEAEMAAAAPVEVATTAEGVLSAAEATATEPEATAPAEPAQPETATAEAATAAPEPAAEDEGDLAGAISAPSRVSVTVFQADGPLDLVRVYNALSAVPGVGGLGIVSYARVRAVFQLTTDRRPSELPLSEALESASNGGVHGRWLGEGEYLAEIGVAG